MIRPSQVEDSVEGAGPTVASEDHARAVGVGRVATEAEHALGAELREPGDVGGLPSPVSDRTGSRR